MKILMPIKEKYFKMLAKGSKTVEVRKHAPNLKENDKIYFYEPHGFLPYLVGKAVVKKMFCIDNNNEMLSHIQKNHKIGLSLDEYKKYLKNSDRHFLITFKAIKTTKQNFLIYCETLDINVKNCANNKTTGKKCIWKLFVEKKPQQKYIILEN